MVFAGLPLIVVKAVVGGKSEKPKEPESVVEVEQRPNQHTEIKTVPVDTYSPKTASSDYLARLHWDIEDDDLVPASKKKLVKQGALKVLKDEPKCTEISYGGSSSSRANHYFVNCGEFNVYFKLSDISGVVA